jgi:hypothetical protein
VPHQDNSALIMVFYGLAGVIIALWLAYPSSVIGAALSKLNISPEHLSYTETVDRTHKKNQVTTVPFNDRWNAFVTSGKSNTAQHVWQIPDGCESAFGGLVKVGNFSARCVT